jgi:hypothetical protein
LGCGSRPKAQTALAQLIGNLIRLALSGMSPCWEVRAMRDVKLVEASTKEIGPWQHFKLRTVEAVALAFWIYAIAQVFFWSDFDRDIISAINPALAWIVDYKFIILLTLFSILLVTVQGANLVSYYALVALYPLFLIFWRLPKLVWRQRSWVFAFAVLNTIISMFARIKSNAIIFATFLTTTAVCVNAHNKTVAVIAMIVLLGVTIFLYFRAFILVFQPSSVFLFYSGLVKRSPGWANKVIQHQQTEFDLPAEKQSEQLIQKQATTVQTLLLPNRLLLFFAKILREYQLSQVSAISFTLNLLVLMIATVIAFAAINMALYHYNPSEFVLTEQSSFFYLFLL